MYPIKVSFNKNSEILRVDHKTIHDEIDTDINGQKKSREIDQATDDIETLEYAKVGTKGLYGAWKRKTTIALSWFQSCRVKPIYAGA